jgi:hypothetical protein
LKILSNDRVPMSLLLAKKIFATHEYDSALNERLMAVKSEYAK